MHRQFVIVYRSLYLFEVATTVRKITNINNEHNPYFRHLLHVYDPGLPLATTCKHIGNRVTDNKQNATQVHASPANHVNKIYVYGRAAPVAAPLSKPLKM